MNLQEFAALKVGDRIENLMVQGNQGEVTEVTPSGVRIRWSATQIVAQPVSFFYSVNTTAWMHWSKVLTDCMCGRGAAGDKPCPGPNGKPACYVELKS